MTSTRWARFTRGWLIAAFSVLVAALSHSFAGGTTPGWLSIVLALAFASMFSIGLAGPRTVAGRVTRTAPSFWRTAVSVAGSQLLFHGLFSVLGTSTSTVAAQGGAAANAANAASAHSGHMMSAADIAAQLAAASPVGSSVAASSLALVPAGAHHDAWMLLGHTLAGVLTLAVILRGEQALRGLSRAAGMALRALAVRPLRLIVLPDAAPARLTASTVWIPRPLDVVQASLRHRGPPAFAQA